MKTRLFTLAMMMMTLTSTMFGSAIKTAKSPCNKHAVCVHHARPNSKYVATCNCRTCVDLRHKQNHKASRPTPQANRYGQTQVKPQVTPQTKPQGTPQVVKSGRR